MAEEQSSCKEARQECDNKGWEDLRERVEALDALYAARNLSTPATNFQALVDLMSQAAQVIATCPELRSQSQVAAACIVVDSYFQGRNGLRSLIEGDIISPDFNIVIMSEYLQYGACFESVYSQCANQMNAHAKETQLDLWHLYSRPVFPDMCRVAKDLGNCPKIGLLKLSLKWGLISL